MEPEIGGVGCRKESRCRKFERDAKAASRRRVWAVKTGDAVVEPMSFRKDGDNESSSRRVRKQTAEIKSLRNGDAKRQRVHWWSPIERRCPAAIKRRKQRSPQFVRPRGRGSTLPELHPQLYQHSGKCSEGQLTGGKINREGGSVHNCRLSRGGEICSDGGKRRNQSERGCLEEREFRRDGKRNAGEAMTDLPKKKGSKTAGERPARKGRTKK